MKFKYLAFSVLCLGWAGAGAQVKVSGGAKLVIESGASVNLNNLSLDYGSAGVIGTGDLIFSGGADNTLTGTGGLLRLTLLKTVGSRLSLASNQSITALLRTNSGLLDLNGYNLDLGSTGSLLNETSNGYVTGSSGYLIANANLNAPSAATPGNIGVALTSTANWGNTVVRRGNYALSDGTNQTIKRFFEIEPTNNSGLDATIRFYYLEGELNSIQENQLKFLYSEDNGTTWRSLASTVNVPQKYIEVSGLNAMGTFSAASQDFTTLPIGDIKLSGKAESQGVSITWSTINERDVDHFVLERSTNGQSFIRVAKVSSKSASSGDNSYSALDRNPTAGTNYYRVKGIDTDGKETVSQIVPIVFSLSGPSLAVYPNPAAKLVKVRYYADNQQPVNVTVVSVAGRKEMTKVFQPQQGLNDLSMDISSLPTGVYFLKVYNTLFSRSIKFIKN